MSDSRFWAPGTLACKVIRCTKPTFYNSGALEGGFPDYKHGIWPLIHCLDLIATSDCSQTAHLRTTLVISEEQVLQGGKCSSPRTWSPKPPPVLPFRFALLSFQNVYSWPPKNRKRSIYLVFRSKQSTAIPCWGSRPSITMKKAIWEVRLRFNAENPQDPQ